MKNIIRGRKTSWLILCLLTAVLYVFENNTGTRILFVSSCLVPFLLIVFPWASARKLSIDIKAPERAVKGQDFLVQCFCCGCAPLTTLRIQLKCGNLLTGEVTEMEGYSSKAAPVEFKIRSEHCGMLTMRASVSACDILGMFGFTVKANCEDYTLTEPDLQPRECGTFEEWAANESNQYAPDKPGDDFSEILSVRDYIEGDPVRRIHWKLSWKMNRILLREMSRPLTGKIRIIFDASQAVHSPQSAALLDEMAEVFFSISSQLLANETPHLMCWQAEGNDIQTICSVESREDWEDMKSRFFCVAPSEKQPLLTPMDEEERVILICALFSAGEVPENIARRLTAVASDVPPDTDARQVISMSEFH